MRDRAGAPRPDSDTSGMPNGVALSLEYSRSAAYFGSHSYKEAQWPDVTFDWVSCSPLVCWSRR